MTRKKKSRRTGSGPTLQPRIKSSSKDTSKKKGKGLSSGNRNSEIKNLPEIKQHSIVNDKVGSKKKVPLINEAPNEESLREAEVRLVQLENDPRLNQLLDKVENGASLHPSDKKWMNQQLNEIESLFVFLGLDDEE